MSLKKSVKDLDDLIATRAGHILFTFIIVAFKDPKGFSLEDFGSSGPVTFQDVLLTVSRLQQERLPMGDRVNPGLAFIGCTANICYIRRQTNQFFVANLGDSRSMYMSFRRDGSK